VRPAEEYVRLGRLAMAAVVMRCATVEVKADGEERFDWSDRARQMMLDSGEVCRLFPDVERCRSACVCLLPAPVLGVLLKLTGRALCIAQHMYG
jgi:hypothetical protein